MGVTILCEGSLLYRYKPYLCKTFMQAEGGGVSRSAWFKHRWFRAQCDPFKKNVLTIMKFWGVIEHPLLTPFGVLNWHMQLSTPKGVTVKLFINFNSEV